MRRPLTATEMDHLRAAVEAEDMPFDKLVVVLTEFYTLVCPEEYGQTWDELSSVDPKLFQIPAAQWEEIGSWLIVQSEAMESSNVLLDWVNKGPSAYAAL